MRNVFIMLFIGFELFGWWFVITDIKEAIKKRMRILDFSIYWVLLNVFILSMYVIAKLVLVRW